MCSDKPDWAGLPFINHYCQLNNGPKEPKPMKIVPAKKTWQHMSHQRKKMLAGVFP
jgi:hypothetical protein